MKLDIRTMIEQCNKIQWSGFKKEDTYKNDDILTELCSKPIFGKYDFFFSTIYNAFSGTVLEPLLLKYHRTKVR